MGQRIRGGLVIRQTADFHSLLQPGLVITVIIEDDALMIVNGTLDDFMQRSIKIGCLLQFIGKILQHCGNRCIKHDIRAGDGIGGTHRTEFKFIAGKRERRRTIAVRRVLLETRQCMHAKLQRSLLSRIVSLIIFNTLQDGGQLRAQEHGHDSRRRFTGAQAVVVAGCGNGNTKKILVFIDRTDHCNKE